MASYLYEAEGRENVAREQETSEWLVLSTQLKLVRFRWQKRITIKLDCDQKRAIRDHLSEMTILSPSCHGLRLMYSWLFLTGRILAVPAHSRKFPG